MSLYEAGPKKKTKEQESYDAEVVMLKEISSVLSSKYKLVGYIAETRESGMTNMKLKGTAVTVSATAGTVYGNGTDKHHEVTVQIDGKMSMAIDIYDEPQFKAGAKTVAENVMKMIKNDEEEAEEAGGDADSILEQLKDEGFESVVTYESEDMQPPYVRSDKWQYRLRTEVEKSGQDKIRISIWLKKNNKSEGKAIIRVVTLPLDGGADFAWQQLQEMCESLKISLGNRPNANAALDKLCRREKKRK